jgi:hypothetical protein
MSLCIKDMRYKVQGYQNSYLTKSDKPHDEMQRLKACSTVRALLLTAYSRKTIAPI